MKLLDASNGRLPWLGFIIILAASCLFILRPFLSALGWAVIVCYSTWPIYLWIERRVGGYRKIAAALATALVTLLVMTPFTLVIAALAENAHAFVAASTSAAQNGLPALPPWIAKIPIIGKSLSDYWAGLAHNSPALFNELKALIRPAADFAVNSGTRVGAGLFELSLAIFIVFFAYLHGGSLAASGRKLVSHYTGPRGHRVLTVAGKTLKGVVYGLIGTALAQAALAAIGFFIAGIPQALLLSVLTFFLSFAPIGPPLVWISVAVWLFTKGEVGWGIFIFLWGLLLISSVDNIIRPYLVGRTANLPILLSLFGFIGGVLAFGVIGIFIGPMVLAVGYSVVKDWIDDFENRPAPQAATG